MKRFFIVSAALVSLFNSGYSFWYYNIREMNGLAADYSIWLSLVLPISLLFIGLGLVVWACDDNLYNISEGEIIGHDFTEAHMTPTTYVAGAPPVGDIPGRPMQIIPGLWEDDDWAIQLQDDKGRTGWLHFDTNVFAIYPLHSHYRTSSSSSNASGNNAHNEGNSA